MRTRPCRSHRVPSPPVAPRVPSCAHPSSFTGAGNRDAGRPRSELVTRLTVTSTHAPTTAPADILEDALFEAKRILVGQDRMIERLFVAWLARGHILLEGAPGLAKTLAAETVARVLGGSFTRIQFTPDLVPADLVGTRVYRPSREAFDIELGPVFAN